MTISIKTCGIVIHRIKTFSVLIFSIMTPTLRHYDIQHYDNQHTKIQHFCTRNKDIKHHGILQKMLSIMTLAFMGLMATLRSNVTQHNVIL
jgi:hypothetical protein